MAISALVIHLGNPSHLRERCALTPVAGVIRMPSFRGPLAYLLKKKRYISSSPGTRWYTKVAIPLGSVYKKFVPRYPNNALGLVAVQKKIAIHR